MGQGVAEGRGHAPVWQIKSFVLITETAFFASFFFKYNPDTFLYFSLYEMKVSHATLMPFKALEVLLKTCPLLCGPIR